MIYVFFQVLSALEDGLGAAAGKHSPAVDLSLHVHNELSFLGSKIPRRAAGDSTAAPCPAPPRSTPPHLGKRCSVQRMTNQEAPQIVLHWSRVRGFRSVLMHALENDWSKGSANARVGRHSQRCFIGTDVLWAAAWPVWMRRDANTTRVSLVNMTRPLTDSYLVYGVAAVWHEALQGLHGVTLRTGEAEAWEPRQRKETLAVRLPVCVCV